MQPSRIIAISFFFLGLFSPVFAGTGVHTTWLWHMHQPIYWPAESGWNPGRYETAYETMVMGHSQNDEFEIFNKDDRVADYQWYPRDAITSVLDLPEAGAQISFAGSLMENIFSLGDAGWNGGQYAADWYAPNRTAMGWNNLSGQPRLDPLLVGFHHAIGPLMDDTAFRMELACAREIASEAWGPGTSSQGFFPAEMCFSERLIPALVAAGVQWSVVPDLHLARACGNYPYAAHQDNCDPPNRADQINSDQSAFTNHFISRGVSLKIPYPFGFTPHRARYVDPATGEVSSLVVVPAANAMGWEEGYGLFGTGGIEALAPANNPDQPMLVLLAHDGDNSWSGGYSYYNENVTQFAHNAAADGYTPTTVQTYLQNFPVPANDLVHVEDGGWVNADGDFGSPQYINWNWPLVDEAGQFDIPGGWAEDQRNWAILTAAQNRVETAAEIIGTVVPAHVVHPENGANDAERAWHFLLAGYESGYMYYGTSLDMEIKATLACNQAVDLSDPVISGGADQVAPTIWLPQRFPWNPGGFGGGALWGWPSGEGAAMSSAFQIYTFVHDVSGLARVELMVREDTDGWNDPDSDSNELYAGGSGVGAWLGQTMNQRVMPLGEPWDMGGVDLTVLPEYIADEYWLELSGYSDVLLDYFVEAEDLQGHIKRSPIQHVYVGTGDNGSGVVNQPFVMDGDLDSGAILLAESGGSGLWVAVQDSWLYLATNALATNPDRDAFLLISDKPEQTRGAPWAKSGTCAPWVNYLARESSNSWMGWFDAEENVLQDVDHGMASGSVLEGTVNLDTLYGGDWPSTLYLALGLYQTFDGGLLTGQVPAGDGDGDLELPEYAPLDLRTTAVPQTRNGQGRLLAFPNPFNAQINLVVKDVAAGPVHLKIHDATGRLVRRLSGEAWSGEVALTWNGRDDQGRSLPSGVYFVRSQGINKGLNSRLVLVK